jgi:putative transposase
MISPLFILSQILDLIHHETYLLVAILHKECWIEEGHIMADHVHMLLNVPPKIAVSSVVGYIKGKSAIHIARHFMKRGRNYAGQVFWARGYFVDTVGRDTETIRRYIADQEKEDQRLDQLEMPWIESQTNANKKN